jgi:ribosome-associated toxin RatA of RatAB toxin-antitoxin module
MRSIRRSARVPYTAAQMFDLVNDVEAYPQFLHWCRGARIEGRGGDTIEAVLDIGISGIHKSFRTRNSLEAPNAIEIELISGPFRHLDGKWSFEDLEDGGSQVSLLLEFEVVASPLSMIFSTVFEELARSQMNAFVERARVLYG